MNPEGITDIRYSNSITDQLYIFYALLITNFAFCGHDQKQSERTFLISIHILFVAIRIFSFYGTHTLVKVFTKLVQGRYLK